MFGLLYGLWQWLVSKTEYRILILGLDNAGKTTFLEQLKHQFSPTGGMALEKITPTVGLNIGRIDFAGCKLLVWDLGGQVSLRKIWDKYYSDTHAVCFVVDAADPERFAEVQATFASLLENTSLGDVPIVICANKRDKPNYVPSQQLLQQLNIETIIHQHPLVSRPPHYRDPSGRADAFRHYRAFDVSALSGDGLRDSIAWLVDELNAHPRPSQPG
jgi:ADP-ribosylation factor related protein 1